MIPASASAILDYIGKHEAPRGYDDYRRTAKAPPKPLTQMTIREVQHWQSYANPGRDTAAAGKYQIIEATFNDVVRQMGLRGDEVFDADLQDRMGLHLLKRRGFDSFVAGSLSAEAFCNELAKEWASMPLVTGPRAGRSYYADDGLNQSLTRADEFLRVVRESRNAPKTSPVPKPRPEPSPWAWLWKLLRG